MAHDVKVHGVMARGEKAPSNLAPLASVVLVMSSVPKFDYHRPFAFAS